jgi:hypothetical protein
VEVARLVRNQPVQHLTITPRPEAIRGPQPLFSVQSVLQLLPGSAHLRVVLVGCGELQKPCTICVTLRMGSRIIYVEQTAEDPLTAYDVAVRALLNELRTSAGAGSESA